MLYFSYVYLRYSYNANMTLNFSKIPSHGGSLLERSPEQKR